MVAVGTVVVAAAPADDLVPAAGVAIRQALTANWVPVTTVTWAPSTTWLGS